MSYDDNGNKVKGWIGVDLDGTLAQYHGWDATNHGQVGAPVPLMVDRVKAWLEEGEEVRIFTARVSRITDHPHALEQVARQRVIIAEWCKLHLGRELPIVCCKDLAMRVLYDDRVVRVEHNTGRLL